MAMMTFKDRRPSIACEFSPTQVVAARAAAGGIMDTSTRQLQAGALVPSLTGSNISDRTAVRAALQESLLALGSSRSRDLVAVLPDASCRVVLIDLDVLPERREEAEVLIRHRVKKSLPFDVDDARLSWQVQEIKSKTNVLVAVTHKTVLQEYESVVREAGYSPGLVLPSVLASLRLADAGVPTLLVKLDAATTSIVIVHESAVLLVRVLDRIPGQRSENSKLADDVYASLVFLQDAYGTRVQKILISSISPCEQLQALLEQLTGVRPQQLAEAAPLDPGASESERSALGAVAGAVA